MVLIITTGALEVSVDEVIDWLDFYEVPFVRFNCEDIDQNAHFRININNDIDLLFYQNNKRYTKEDITTVWFRKNHSHRTLEYLDAIKDKKLWKNLKDFLSNEATGALDAFCIALKDKQWIDAPQYSSLNKIQALLAAAKCGLDIPETIISNRLSAFETLKKTSPSVITKPITDVAYFESKKLNFPIYTQEILDTDLINEKGLIFPTLLQEGILKDYEIRVFYLNGHCWSMAIFSQNDERTKTDFRMYNLSTPNRFVPYHLPSAITQKICDVMNQLNLKSGSLDFIRGKNGKYYFLEVNVVGQLGMISKNCNYPLEKELALFLKHSLHETESKVY